ncbi:DMT family transporter [Sphingomonas aerophila]|uniref:Drug/metabolite transporter (DMT)-like permease n=1 Tax=Sphingomonas aerophila TaxID=1344948 RepID=A0A7W9ESY0_9SPHN|nr:DMT family transporter [Sphingomonas aerophila]MBB5713599.1 drug/metabolite transporter (DMT)-like permease [Sphingomonas aerophila]
MHQRDAETKTVAEAKVASERGSVVGSTLTPLGLVAILIANVALAFGPWFVRLADTQAHIGPIAAGFWRIGLAAPVLALLAWGSGARPVRLGRAMLVTLVLGGVAFAADLGSWHLGILRTTLANATLFGNSATLMFPIYGFLAARAWPSRAQGLALLLAAIGAGLLMGRSYQLDAGNLAGDLLCLLAGLLYTVYFVLMARARATMAPLPALALSTAASVLPLLVFAIAMGERIWPADWTPLLGLALASQVIGQGCMIYALGTVSPLVVGIALLIQPVVAGAVGWIAYGERLGTADWIGAALVAAALVLVRQGRAVAPTPRATRLAG